MPALISFSLIPVLYCSTACLSRIQAGRLGPQPRQSMRRRMHVWHDSPTRCSSHFLRLIRHVQQPPFPFAAPCCAWGSLGCGGMSIAIGCG
ncbi:hypothetical protein DFH11DRAFT_1570568 [Phellopilus nigrolimitatus]|nr:hypothetical protein DFH11DRAFT_1570568 [Phellopilus nigrolimitatus]